MLSIFNDEYFMKEAMKQAQLAYDAGEVPVGAVIVNNQTIIAKAHNQTEQLTDVTAHAEILAITAAADHLGVKYLKDCTIYVTLEPCVMCAGALAWSQIGKIAYAAQDEKRGFMRYGKDLLHPKTKVAYGIMEWESNQLLKSFFTQRRSVKQV